MYLQKLAYQLILAGFPTLTYNPLNRRPFQSTFEIQPKSFYINFKMQNQFIIDKVNEKISPEFELYPIIMSKDEKPEYFLSLNVYNVCSPLLNTDKHVTRCELNTYVRRKKDNMIGTIILDYTSNMMSMDPVNIFKFPNSNTKYWKHKNYFEIESIGNIFSINATFNDKIKNPLYIHDDLHRFTDKVYYINGIYDKIFYDSSLTHAKTYYTWDLKYNFTLFNDSNIRYHSSFYFLDKIHFTGAMWYNLFENTK
tara:strand:+ start:9190 stop:9948 length:759 start_codon:yes stop_codon:yes gene_type:complete